MGFLFQERFPDTLIWQKSQTSTYIVLNAKTFKATEPPIFSEMSYKDRSNERTTAGYPLCKFLTRLAFLLMRTNHKGCCWGAGSGGSFRH